MTTSAGSAVAARAASQPSGGGAIPTSALHSYRARLVPAIVIRGFIQTHHYSHNTNGVKVSYAFGLFSETGELVGGALFGAPATRGVSESYCPEAPGTVIELRRLVLIDETPRNAESYFIGYMLRWLRKHTTLRIVLAYADLNYGHHGSIYAASNFSLVGQVTGIKKILWNGRVCHDRSLRTRYNGRLKPFSVRLRAALQSGEAKWIESQPKNIWLWRMVEARRAGAEQETLW